MGAFALLWLWLAPVGGATPTQPIADALTVQLGAASCAQAEALSEQLEVWTRRPRLDARLRIEVREDADDARRAHFELWSDDEQLVGRRIEPLPENCDAYRAALALAIAFALDATVLQELGVPAAEPVAEREREAEFQSGPPSSPGSGPASGGGEATAANEGAGGLRAGIDLGAVAGVGAAPGASFGGVLSLRFDLHRNLSLAVGGEMQQGLARQLGEGQISMRFVLARAALCGGGALGRVDLRACMGSLAGSVWIDGKDYQVEHQTRAPWVAFSLGPQLRAPVAGRFSFVAALDAILPLARVEARVLDSDGGQGGLSLRPPALGGRAFLGLGVRFP